MRNNENNEIVYFILEQLFLRRMTLGISLESIIFASQ